MNDQIFQLESKKTEPENYRFVVLKINKIFDEKNQNNKLLIQIIDMSDKILYS